MQTQLDSCLVASGNTYNPCLLVLRQKGYDVWLEQSEPGTLWLRPEGRTELFGVHRAGTSRIGRPVGNIGQELESAGTRHL